MEAQQPAEAVSKHSQYESFDIHCTCTDPDHTITLSAEDDEDFGILMYFKVVCRTNSFVERLKKAVTILRKGYIEYDGDTLLTAQGAYNVGTLLIEQAHKHDKTNS